MTGNRDSRMDGFNPEDHPRGENGRFTDKPGSGLEAAGAGCKKAKELYPNETWTSEKVGEKSFLFVASAREEDGAKNKKVFASDKMMATVLAKSTETDVFLIPERSNGKNPDCVFEGETMELKHVRGGRDKVGKNAIYALDQSPNTFLFVDKNYSIGSCIAKIKGSVSTKRDDCAKNGEVFIEPPKDARLYIFTQGKLYRNVWGDVL